MKNCKLLLALVFLCSTARAATTTGYLYEKNSEKKNLLFIQKIVKSMTDTGKISKSTFQDAKSEDKEVVVQEELTLNPKGDFKKYIVEHKQLNEKWIIEKKNNKVYFKKHDFGSNKVKEDDEKWPKNFVVGPMIMDHLRANWKTLEKGKDISVRLGVASRLETIGFKFYKKRESKRLVDGKEEPVVEVVMKPTGFMIALLVKPIRFYIRKKDKTLVELKGRTLPKVKKGKKWKDTDVEVVYKG